MAPSWPWLLPLPTRHDAAWISRDLSRETFKKFSCSLQPCAEDSGQSVISRSKTKSELINLLTAFCCAEFRLYRLIWATRCNVCPYKALIRKGNIFPFMFCSVDFFPHGSRKFTCKVSVFRPTYDLSLAKHP